MTSCFRLVSIETSLLDPYKAGANDNAAKGGGSDRNTGLGAILLVCTPHSEK